MAASAPGTVAVAESAPGSPAPPDRMLTKDPAGLDDRELLDIVRLSPLELAFRISQTHVSRLHAHALGYLRSRLLDLRGTRARAGPAVAPWPPKDHEPAETITC